MDIMGINAIEIGSNRMSHHVDIKSVELAN